jgi:hypothetical protein
MAFIGNQPALAYTSFAVQHFTTSATTSYTLNYPVANENEIRLVINNVVQQPGSSYAYSATGTSLTLTSATTATDTMYAVFLGKAVQTVNPPNGSVGLSQLSATGTKDATTFLRGDNTFAVAGITEADQWRLTANLTGTDAVISSNLERIDTAGQGTLGTGMTQSSGVFTFPSTGIWFVMFSGVCGNPSAADNMSLALEVTTNNSSYATIAVSQDSSGGVAQNQNANLILTSLIDVTNTTNVKVRFSTSSFQAASVLNGDTTANYATFTFIRLGDT